MKALWCFIVPTIVGEPVSVGEFDSIEEAAACAVSHVRAFDDNPGLGAGSVIKQVFE